MRYAISDIHGCIKTFRYLVEEILNLNKEDLLFLLGDYIDRGPDSKGVLDYMMQLSDKGYQIKPLLGNHEEVFLNVLNGKADIDPWMYNGGNYTLRSFGIHEPADIKWFPKKYIDYMTSFEHYYKLDDYLLVHSGFNFKDENPFNDFHSMLWIRKVEIEERFTEGRIIVNGHTPTKINDVLDLVLMENEKRLFIDAGCVYTWKAGMGSLAALNLDTREVLWCENRED